MPCQDLFAWRLIQEHATLLELLAFGMARALDDMHTREGAEHAQAAALDVNMADWWQATSATYFDSVSKAQLIETVTGAYGADVAKLMATQKKAEAVAYAAAKLKGKLGCRRHCGAK